MLVQPQLQVILPSKEKLQFMPKSRKGPWDDCGILALGGFVAANVVVGYPFHYAAIRLSNDVKTTSKGK